jgi:hypothetical protein
MNQNEDLSIPWISESFFYGIFAGTGSCVAAVVIARLAARFPRGPVDAIFLSSFGITILLLLLPFFWLARKHGRSLFIALAMGIMGSCIASGYFMYLSESGPR